MKREIKILLFCSLLNGFAYTLFSPLYAIFVQHLDTDIFVISSSWSVYVFIQGVIMIIFGKIEDYFKNKRFLVVFGYFLLAFGALGFTFVKTIPQLYVVQIINAIAYGILLPAWKASYSLLEDKGKESLEWSLLDGGNLVLASFSALVGGYIVSHWGFSTLFYIIFVLQLMSALYSINLFRRMKHKKK